MLTSLVMLLATPPVSPAAIAVGEVVNPAAAALVPSNLPAVEIVWKTEKHVAYWHVTISGEAGKRDRSTESTRLSVDAKDILAVGGGPGKRVDVAVCAAKDTGSDPSTPGSCAHSNFTVAAEPLNDTIVYRVVDMRFDSGNDSHLEKIDATGSSAEVVGALKTCIGCHSYGSRDLLALNIRKQTERWLLIAQSSTDGWHLFDRKNIGEFSYVTFSPDGRYLAVVLNTRGAIESHDSDVEPFDLIYQSGDLAIYDTLTKRLALLNGASELAFVEDMPVWSPDGRSIVFVRYPTPGPEGISGMRLYRVAFNEGAGGTPEAIDTGAEVGAYVYLPQFSPDGRWLSFVRGDGSHGVFARQTSDIYIMPASGGRPHKLECNTDGVMDSAHRWSSDGHWLLFASKRVDNHTALQISHIDAEGHAAPPYALHEDSRRKVNLPMLWNGPKPPSPAAIDALVDFLFAERK